MAWRAIILLLLVLAAAQPAAAHPVLSATAIATARADNIVEVTVRCDALAFALNDLPARIDDAQMLALLHGPDADLERALAAGRDRFQTLLEVIADGQRVPARVTVAPTVEVVRAWSEAHPNQPLPVKLDMAAEAALPAGTKSVRFRFPGILGDIVLTMQPLHAEAVAALVPAGEPSEGFEPRPHSMSPANASPSAPPAPPRVSSMLGGLRFVWLGVTHILPGPEWFEEAWRACRTGEVWSRPRVLIPDGVDHILFVLGLFFLSPRLRPLLIQITTFTLAHSVTLALSARGVVNMPASIVEPIIAASICFVAVENLCTQKVHAWRPLIVFGFGLVHGLGFAAAFAEAMGEAHPGRAPLGPVLLFNVGVELGQLAVVGLAMLAVARVRGRPWYRARIAIPASVFIAAVGLYWTIERIFIRPG